MYYRIPEDDLSEITAPSFVSVVLQDQAYGGPEEGGWWYFTEERLETHYAATPVALAAIMKRLNDLYSNEDRYPISSVLSEGEYAIVVGAIPEPYTPERRPHYE